MVQKGLTLSQVYDFSSILFNVFHLQPTTILETQDLWAFNLHIPQLYPVEVTPKMYRFLAQHFGHFSSL